MPLASRLTAVLAAVLALAACSPLPALNALVPEGGMVRHEDIAYGPDARQRLDVYTPRRASGNTPVVVFFYGGSWKAGDRGSYLFVAQALASRGFVVVIPDYRLFPQVRFPAFMEDAAAAIAWTEREIGHHGGDPKRIYSMGHSAGAQIATLVAYDERFLRAEGLGRDAIRGVIGMAGPYDFVPSDPDIRATLSAEGSFERAMPARHVRGGEPRTLLITAGRDTTVEPGNTDRLLARLRAANVPVTDRRFPDYNHYTLVGRLAAPFRDEALLDAIAEFIRSEPASTTR
jgi:acetyl esterase/lipase